VTTISSLRFAVQRIGTSSAVSVFAVDSGRSSLVPENRSAGCGAKLRHFAQRKSIYDARALEYKVISALEDRK